MSGTIAGDPVFRDERKVLDRFLKRHDFKDLSTLLRQFKLHAAQLSLEKGLAVIVISFRGKARLCKEERVRLKKLKEGSYAHNFGSGSSLPSRYALGVFK